MQPTSGDRSPATIYDVARRAGVSIATVSRVVNGRHAARPDTERRVLAAVRELGFVPNTAARGLSSGSKKVIGLVFARVWPEDDLLELEGETLLFTDSVIRGAEIAAQRSGYSLLLHSTDRDSAPDAVASLTRSTDGLILADQVMPERQVAPIARHFPIVLLAGSGRSRTARTVRIDNRLAMRAVIEHLVGVHGLHRLAFLSGSTLSPDSEARAHAFHEIAAGVGATVEPAAWWQGDWTSDGAAETMRARLRRPEPLPEAVACASDVTAVGVQHALATAGLRVPDDVAVTGFDDIPLARHLTPALTTVRQPSQRLGRVAVDTLLAKVQGTASDRDVVLGTELVVRASCGCRSRAIGDLARQVVDAAALARELR